MRRVLSLKILTKNPADGVSNFLKSIFGNTEDSDLEVYCVFDGIGPSGIIKKCPRSLFAYMILNKPDVLLGTGHAREFIYLLFKPKSTKYVITFHSVLLKSGEGAWKVKTPWWLRRYIFSKADIVLAPSEFSADSIRSRLPLVRAESILNGVDISLFSPRKENRQRLFEKYNIPNDEKDLVVFVGSMHHRKRPRLFVKVAKYFPNAHFVMVGRDVHEFNASNSSGENIAWVPNMPREDVATLFASARIFLFPSINDASPAVILEAMASGCVPVVSESGGSQEFFKEGEEGFAIPQGEDEEVKFREVLSNLLSNKEKLRAISLRAINKAQDHSWEKVSEEYREVLKKI